MANADKRSVTTDALETLGTIITEKEKRDAIHLAVDNVIAAHTLRPGEDVGFLSDGTAGICEKPLGIVDPFLKNTVKKGERFWLVVYPRRITSLRHVWEHPDFKMAKDKPIKPKKSDEISAKEFSVAWIKAEADRLGVGYDEIITHAKEYIMHEDYWSEGGRFEGEYLNQDFWPHYEIVTGYKVGENRGSFFSCVC